MFFWDPQEFSISFRIALPWEAKGNAANLIPREHMSCHWQSQAVAHPSQGLAQEVWLHYKPALTLERKRKAHACLHDVSPVPLGSCRGSQCSPGPKHMSHPRTPSWANERARAE